MQVLLLIAIAALWHCPQCSAMRRRTENRISYKFYNAASESALVTRNKIDFFVAISTFASTVDSLEENDLGEKKRMVDFYLAPWAEQPFTRAMFTDILQACDQVIDLVKEFRPFLSNTPPINLSQHHLQIFANYVTQLDAMLHLPVFSADGLVARFEPYIL